MAGTASHGVLSSISGVVDRQALVPPTTGSRVELVVAGSCAIAGHLFHHFIIYQGSNWFLLVFPYYLGAIPRTWILPSTL